MNCVSLANMLRATAALCVCLPLAGCSGGVSKPDHIPELTPATVLVTYNGQPVAGASVLMAPNSGEFAAAGTTDATGKAVMKTDGMYDGVVAGEFRVTVAKREKPSVDLGTTPNDPEGYAEFQRKVAELEPPKHLLPERYAAFSTSELTASVTEGSPAELTFALTDD